MKIALTGQPNCGKSTIFNMLAGVHQHIANYPGVTVDKMSAKFSYENEKIELVDLPGTYSFSSYSIEERVTKEFILNEKPDLILNIVDASNIKRNLYLTFQLLEMGIPTVVVLNMTDVAKRRGILIDSQKISQMLGVEVVEAVGSKNEGKEEILKALLNTSKKANLYKNFELNYEELELNIENISKELGEKTFNKRWSSIKALEGDITILEHLKKDTPEIEKLVKQERTFFHDNYDKDIDAFLATFRYDSADVIYHKCVQEKSTGKQTSTDIADKFILNRWFALPILFAVMFLIYELSIVFGYKITDYTWPILASFKNLVIDILPQAYFIEVPMLTELGIWMVNSANALLNYIPIFFILFGLIAVLEDIGYMPRMAFILDRIFRKFGLHGQSTLPLVLGGAMVGGCAVPGVMATKGIADERARMATILTVPLMNCLAKVPFYTLLLGAFFKPDMALMMFFISTVTIFTALIVAKILTSTILINRESTPFLMELPPYHLPTFKGVILRATQRVWTYIKKVVTIVLAVAIILFVMLQFPGVSEEKKQEFAKSFENSIVTFNNKTKNNPYYEFIDEKSELNELLNYYDLYKAKKMSVTSKSGSISVDDNFKQKNKVFFKFIKPKTDKDARKINKALRKLSKNRKKILLEMKNEKVENSLLGMVGRSMEPITQFAGFDWRINVAFLSSFAARESAVATLGSIYDSNQGQRAEEAMAENSGYTPLHATAIIIFMLLTPPCIATMIVVKMQTHSYKWMLFAIFFPITLGIVVSSTVFSLGMSNSWSGLEAMTYFYMTVVAITLILGFIPNKQINWRGAFRPKVDGIYFRQRRNS